MEVWLVGFSGKTWPSKESSKLGLWRIKLEKNPGHLAENQALDCQYPETGYSGSLLFILIDKSFGHSTLINEGAENTSKHSFLWGEFY